MDVVISADGHVGETAELWARVPEPLRERAIPRLQRNPDGSRSFEMHGARLRIPPRSFEPGVRELEREFRRDPTQGADLEVRAARQLRDGVHAEVVFPNLLLLLGHSADVELNLAVARAYNEWAAELFAPERWRYVPAAWIPVDDLDFAVAEAERAIRAGFRTLLLPASYPWRPYHHPDYEPLWSLAERASIPLSFHVFTGNLGLGTDFASIESMTVEEFAARKRAAGHTDERIERLSTTVLGMAAGMGPVVHLTGGGVLERHPELRFVITEAECGWLPWVLGAMDSMQDKRGLGLRTLALRPSEYFRRQGAVTITDDPIGVRLLDAIGAERLLWGNDFPHDEGTYLESEPTRRALREAAGPEGARAILAGNAARIYGFDLAEIAARVGLQ